MTYIPPKLREFEVRDNRPLGDGLFELLLVPADGEPLFTFVAGQWVMLHVLNDDGSTWGKAAFTIASAPSESHEALTIAVKIYGDYTKKLQALKPKDRVKVQGPYGAFVLEPGETPLVMFAGGIGITPFRSMIRELIAANDMRPVTLFYSCRTPAEACYLQEFVDIEQAHPVFHFVPILTREAPEHWEGETRRLDKAMLEKYLGTFDNTEYLMCGAPDFMDGIRAMLLSKNVDVKLHLRKESF